MSSVKFRALRSAFAGSSFAGDPIELLAQQREEKLDEFRTISRLHGVPTGSWQDLLNLPLRISQDSGFRSDLSEIIGDLQVDHLHLPEVLDLLQVAVGGSSVALHSRELGETSDLLGGFLASVGRWPDIEAEPILREGEVPAGIQNFTHPPSPSNGARPVTQAPANGTHGSAPETAASVPVPKTVPPELTESALAGALARLERGNLELRAHLESIDQRISRIEPLLELNAPLAAENAGPRRTLATAWQAANQEAPPQLHTPAPLPEPLPVPKTEPVHPPSTESQNTAPAPSATPIVSTPADEPHPPQRAAFLSEDKAAPSPALTPEPASRSQPDHPVPPSPENDIFLHPGFLNTGINSPDAEDLQVAAAARRRRSIFLACLAVFLLALASAGVYLYLRSGSASNDTVPSSSGITALPAPRTSADELTSSSVPTPGKPSNGRVLDSRSAFKPQQAGEEPSTSNGFRPAETFVSASIMEGHLISAPLPDRFRTPQSAGLKGMVILEANISPSGLVEDADVLGGSRALRSAAIDAVRNWRYRPYLVNGSPVEVRTIIRMDFNERKSEPAEPSAPFPQ